MTARIEEPPLPMMPPTFRAPHAPTLQERERATDLLRGSARARGYDATWDRASLGFRRRHPICEACAAVGITSATAVTDHVVPHKGDRVVFWDRKRWQPACQWHHDVVKQILEQQFEDGLIGEADLWLTSPVALALAARMRP
jgi:5-methylcytosine-specific restriction enzyme A